MAFVKVLQKVNDDPVIFGHQKPQQEKWVCSVESDDADELTYVFLTTDSEMEADDRSNLLATIVGLPVRKFKEVRVVSIKEEEI